jgi:hypothetical protein
VRTQSTVEVRASCSTLCYSPFCDCDKILEINNFKEERFIFDSWFQGF